MLSNDGNVILMSFLVAVFSPICHSPRFFSSLSFLSLIHTHRSICIASNDAQWVRLLLGMNINAVPSPLALPLYPFPCQPRALTSASCSFWCLAIARSRETTSLRSYQACFRCKA